MNLFIKNVPEELAARLWDRAKLHHRSLQGELLSILEDTLSSTPLTVHEAYRRVHELDFKTGAEAVTMVREDRDAR